MTDNIIYLGCAGDRISVLATVLLDEEEQATQKGGLNMPARRARLSKSTDIGTHPGERQW